MSLIRRTGIILALAAASSFFVIAAPSRPSQGAALSHKQAMAMCRQRYGSGITGVSVQKNGRIVCQEGPGRNATRQEVYDYCKKTLSAQTLSVRKKSNGKWECRYYGRY